MAERSATAIFGGSFDPPHYGHLLAAAWALLSGEIKEVWMMPVYRHPFNKQMAPFHHRIEMCNLGSSKLSPNIKVLDWEKKFNTVYTVDTIRKLIEKFPQRIFRLLIGSDILTEKEQWKEFSTLEKLAPPLIAPRGGFDRLLSVPSILPKISSSEIRRKIASGDQSVKYLVPPEILEYIRKNRLYLNI